MIPSAKIGTPTLAVGIILTLSQNVFAGMTVYGLNDLYRLRFQELSFFLFLLFSCILAFRFLWNSVAKDLSWMPSLGWRQATCLSLLLGVFMLLILTMISGIREVLTPEAWRKQGTAYRLNSAEQEPVRKRSIGQLRWALFSFADTNYGRFPKHDFTGEIADKLWEAADSERSRYIYFPGKEKAPADSKNRELLVIEPPHFGSERFGILTTGEVRKFTTAEIHRLIGYTNEKGARYGG